MSFTSEVKNQICNDPLDARQSRAQLCALFQMRAALHLSRDGMYISYQTENATIAKHIFQQVKSCYDVNARLSVIKKMRLNKNNTYCVEIHEKAMEILEDLKIWTDAGLNVRPDRSVIRSEKMARAYLQGCFLAGGSVNHPKTTNYHLEIACTHTEMAKTVQSLMERFYLPAKSIRRKQSYVVYLKAGDKIGDFLRLCNASQALLDFEGVRIQRDFFNQMRRLDNCEIANEMKAVQAAAKQLEYIAILDANRHRVRIPEKIEHVMEMRKQFPEATMQELCDECYKAYGDIIKKSGMKHRLNKIKTMALALTEDAE